MTLHSQKVFSVRNEDKGRDVYVPPRHLARYLIAQDQDAYAEKMLDQRKKEVRAEPPVSRGRPSEFEKYRALLAKHGELTTGDLATLTGATKKQAEDNVRNWSQRGYLLKTVVKNTSLWRLA